ncbi:hypothetical protein TNCT_636941 [Trichonephila clavata]|uniref:Uncharacterized protein n=1 Tax=Trichonephila clavata TaxID=2740835 RepID=A0A8X6LGW7_TRICU|nr:hypothetical protein TNCT_636941 [Trichonephila clavata]
MLLFELLPDVAARLCCCCWICYRMSLPAFAAAVGSATGCRCLPLQLDLLPNVVAFSVRSATGCRCLPLQLDLLPDVVACLCIRSATGCHCLTLQLDLLPDVLPAFAVICSCLLCCCCLICYRMSLLPLLLICYRMSLPAFAVRSATGCRCLPLQLDLLPDVVVCLCS